MNQLRISIFATLLILAAVPATAALPDRTVFLLPINCAELLPDSGPFMGFFGAVGQGMVGNDKPTAKRIFRILSYREKLTEERGRDQNPVDVLVRKTLCFYREQKDPLRAVPYDDPEFVTYLKSSLKELEGKVEDAIFLTEYERAQRQQFELQMEKNQGIVEKLANEAEKEADKSYNRLSNAAKKKVKLQ